ncbi:hypothetical protein [Nonomuraea fuscirosea]|uniref:hypothetical protein n=1 Tax=Nonomuraea fuscirosea TaxID=1291556 RepID=UPI0011B222D1|nr:hypothetical protein [Nonomuraea fuscirosea]
MRRMKLRVVIGRGALVGTIVGAVEGAISWSASGIGIAIYHMLAMWVVPVPLGAALAYRARLPHWGVAALAGPLTFAFLIQALNALMPNPSLFDLPEACYAFPFVLAAAISYAAAAWAASDRASWLSRAAAAVAICASVVAVLQGRVAVADWYKERALENLDIPLLALDLPGYRFDYSWIIRSPGGRLDDVGLDLGYHNGDSKPSITILPAFHRTPETWCTEQPVDVPQLACRTLPGGNVLQVGDHGMSLYARQGDALIRVVGTSEAEVRTILAHLRPASPASLARV